MKAIGKKEYNASRLLVVQLNLHLYEDIILQALNLALNLALKLQVSSTQLIFANGN